MVETKCMSQNVKTEKLTDKSKPRGRGVMAETKCEDLKIDGEIDVERLRTNG